MKSSRKLKILGGLLLLFILTTIICRIFPLQLFSDQYSKVILAENGRLLNATVANDGQWRFPEVEQLNDKYVTALLHYEDKRFFYHYGIDPLAIIRAIYLNIKLNKIASGGSTISMQLSRISNKNPPRTYFAKLQEAFKTIWIEMSYSKQDILIKYASHAPFGGNVVGINAASWRYFGRSSENMSWAEASLLAVLPNNPSAIHIAKNRAALTEKRNTLLKLLLDKSIIDKETYNLSTIEPIPEKPLPLPQQAYHFAQFISSNNASITTTTIDEQLQHQVVNLGENYLKRLEGNGIHNYAVLVIELATGNIKSYVGNRLDKNPEHDPFVDLIHANRSTGSTLKPFLYARLLDEGMFLPTSLVKDIPTLIQGFAPKNYDKGFRGAVPFSDALSMSLNVPAVRLLRQYGLDKYYEDIKTLKLQGLNKGANHYGLSIILGGGECSLYELTRAYSFMGKTLNTFIHNESQYINPSDFRLNGLKGKTITYNLSSNNEYMSAGAIYSTLDILTNVNRPYEERLWTKLGIGKKVAWKTGTSYGNKDAWAIGLNAKYAVGVWVGNADGEGRASLTGASTAGPLLFDVFNVLPSNKWFDVPLDDISSTIVCTKSGFKIGLNCSESDSIFIPLSAQNTATCPYHQKIFLDKTERYQVNNTCYLSEQIITKNWFQLPPSMAYYYNNEHSFYSNIPPFLAQCATKEERKIMEFIYPKDDTNIILPRNYLGERESAVFKVAHTNKKATIFWYLDGELIGNTKTIHQMAINSEKGKHQMLLIDNEGNELELRFEVLE